MHTSQCVQCRRDFQHPNAGTKYCSKDCISKASYERRRDTGTYVKKRTLYDGQCQRCDAPFRLGTNRGKMPRFCSRTCAALAAGELPRTPEQLARPRRIRQCGWCQAPHTNPKFCSSDCRHTSAAQQARSMWSPLRAAIDAGDHASVIATIRDKAIITASGCWEWQGQTSSEGYAVIKVGRKRMQVHRIVTEAKHGAPLGSQAAHHMCANRRCVSPDHLQPVTYAANNAEMMARRAYQDRIADLESALAEVAPHHPLLGLIRCA